MKCHHSVNYKQFLGEKATDKSGGQKDSKHRSCGKRSTTHNVGSNISFGEPGQTLNNCAIASPVLVLDE